MSDIATTGRAFTVRHPADRTFFLIMLLVIWAAMLGGFGYDMAKRAAEGTLHYPWIIHAHALAYGGWLALFTAQILLIRRGDYRTHQRMGVVALILLPLMAVLGPAAAIITFRMQTNDPHLDTAFFITQFTNVLGVVTLSIAGLLKRRDAAAHKRLMLLGMIAIMEPGFSRIWAEPLWHVFGDGFWQYLAFTYPGSIAMVVAVGVYDYVTRRRLHPAYVAGALWIFALELCAAWLYYQPWWASFSRSILVG